MIRALALILGLLLGLTLALLVGGTLGHARMLAARTGWELPGWTAGLDESSGITGGRGDLNGAALRWRWDGWTGIEAALTGPDWQAQGRLRPAGTALRVDALGGVVPLDWLGAGPGLLALEAGEVILGLDGALRAARLDGQARGSEPEGAVTLTWDGSDWALASR
ncbi:MAG: hypothetical protein KDK12_09175 [Rhodobacteraceae bacterium]|nr:hypothetical protein [Paracoccaceae bacterium]